MKMFLYYFILVYLVTPSIQVSFTIVKPTAEILWNRVFDIVCKDPSLTKREIADTIGIRCTLYFTEELHMKKLFGKLVFGILTRKLSLNLRHNY